MCSIVFHDLTWTGQAGLVTLKRRTMSLGSDPVPVSEKKKKKKNGSPREPSQTLVLPTSIMIRPSFVTSTLHLFLKLIFCPMIRIPHHALDEHHHHCISPFSRLSLET